MLWAILGLGLVLRICVMVFYTPTVFNYYGGDSARYMRLHFVGISGLFGDYEMPAGYPVFLAALRDISGWLPFTTMIQHLLGLASAVLLYAAVVRAGAPRWAALLPAVVVVLSGDELFLEHGIFTEALWMPAVALGMYLLARAIAADSARWWLVAGGAALACSALVRNVALALPVLLAIWAAFALPARPRTRLRHGLAVLLPAAVVVVAYTIVAEPIAGGRSGLSENSGFLLYGRVAQFADCTEFTPPKGTERLCVTTPPGDRPGPFFWGFSPESPLHTRVQFDGFDSNDQALLLGFGETAILNQPLDYLGAVAQDVGRPFWSDLGPVRPDSGSGPREMSFENTFPVDQTTSLAQQANQFEEAYSGVGSGVASKTARTALGSYQSVFRVHGLLALLFIGLALAGVTLGPPVFRAGASLFLVAGLAMLVLPAMTWSYDVRYTVLPFSLLSAGAAFGLAGVAQRLRARRG